MNNVEVLAFIALVACALLFIGFLYLKNTLNNCISLVKGLAERMDIEIDIKK